jgi:hypothetical protein
MRGLKRNVSHVPADIQVAFRSGFAVPSSSLRDIDENSHSYLAVHDTGKAKEKLGGQGAPSGQSGPRGAGIRPMFRLLGTPEEHKLLIFYDTGHIPLRSEYIKETLARLDEYLGPVER